MDEIDYIWKLEESLKNRNNEVGVDKFIADLNRFLDEFCIDLLFNGNVIYLQTEGWFEYFQYMKDMLKEMVSDSDSRFLLYFKKKFYEFKGPLYDPFRWSGVEYRKFIECNSYMGYCLILYMILKSYEYQKENFDNFKAIVNDIEHLSPKRINKLDDFVLYFNNRINIVDYIVSKDNYSKNDTFRKFIEAFVAYPGEGSVEALLSFLNNEISYIKSLEGYEKFNMGLQDLVEKAINKTDNSYGASPIDYEYCLNYSRILLIRDRFSYFYNKMYGFENNSFFKEQILAYTRKLTYVLFEELNDGSDKDSFKKCMDIVFDSDSYLELFDKLNDLDRACLLYDDGKKKDAYEIVRELESDKYKAIYCGKKIMYPNIMNRMDKPDSIIDRMMDLYSKIDDSISYDFIKDLYINSCDSDIFLKKVNSTIKWKKSIIGRMKKKLERNFSKQKKKVL